MKFILRLLLNKQKKIKDFPVNRLYVVRFTFPRRKKSQMYHMKPTNSKSKLPSSSDGYNRQPTHSRLQAILNSTINCSNFPPQYCYLKHFLYSPAI